MFLGAGIQNWYISPQHMCSTLGRNGNATAQKELDFCYHEVTVSTSTNSGLALTTTVVRDAFTPNTLYTQLMHLAPGLEVTICESIALYIYE